MNTNKLKIKDLVCGIQYRFCGDVQNGNIITHENVLRKLVAITSTHLILECGRRFIINRNLVVTYY